MIVEIICIGTELLMGNIVNTNAAYLAKQCANLGVSVYHQSVVGDNPTRLSEVLKLALSRADVVITSGGLGPTRDDLTKETVAQIWNKEMVCCPEAYEAMVACFEKLQRPMTENNKKQAYIPEGSRALINANGTAPGILVEEKEQAVVLLPGPPGELIPMFETYVAPYLREKSGQVLSSVMVKLVGIGESAAETKILDLIDKQTNPTIAPYAKTGEVHLRVTAHASTEAEAKGLLAPVVAELKARFGSHVYTTVESVTLEEAIGKRLLEEGKTLSFAESMTGGLLCGRMINVPGISQVIKESYVTYSDEAKMHLLSVEAQTLDAHGAVSEETAAAMAQGLLTRSGADIAVSVTGEAGPDPSEEQPVGRCFIAYADARQTHVHGFQFYGTRNLIRERGVCAALSMLWNYLNRKDL